jgi:hypothetical protein
LIGPLADANAQSMNRDCLGKRKFRFHLDLKKEVAHSPIPKNGEWTKLITSKVRGSVK